MGYLWNKLGTQLRGASFRNPGIEKAASHSAWSAVGFVAAEDAARANIEWVAGSGPHIVGGIVGQNFLVLGGGLVAAVKMFTAGVDVFRVNTKRSAKKL